MDSSSPDEQAPLSDFTIVAIGASAGGLESIERLFRALPPAPGLAFVIVQHLSPDFRSVMDELMGRYTDLTVRRAQHMELIQPDHVYLLPPGQELEVQNGRLLLFPRTNAGLNLPIDRLFTSLAKDVEDRAVAVILSGTGTDGSRGAKRVRQSGGVVLVEDPQTARFDGMPQAAIDADVADLVMAPESLATALAGRAFRHNMEERAPSDNLGKIFGLLHSAFAIDFSQYKVSTVLRRIQRRVDMRHMETLRGYAERLQEDPKELSNLGHDLLIGVTEFFRDADAWNMVREQVLPKLVAEADQDTGLRAWVAGCASGEEAYSLAMLIGEEVRRSRPNLAFKVFASDVHRGALEKAGQGIYAGAAFESADQDLVARYFMTRSDGSRQVNQQLRQAVVFAHHNLLRNAPFTRLDLITCRNMLIYFRPTAQEYALSVLSYGLRVGGVMMLGPSETLGPRASADFETLHDGLRIFRKEHATRRMPLLPSSRQTSQSPVTRSADRRDAKLLAYYDAVLDHVMPASFLLDTDRELVDSFCGAESLLQLRRRRPSHDFLDLVPESVRTAISVALTRAMHKHEEVAFSGLPWDENKYDLRISPIKVGDHARALLIQLQPHSATEAKTRDHAERYCEDDLYGERVQNLERELKQAQENLQATVEELETSNEEMQATNEELVAANEELQSSNEELQSVNEELHTVNSEHQAKIREVTKVNRDIRMLLESIGEAVILLDGALLIRRFTAHAATLFGLLKHDLGRPLSSFQHPLRYPELIQDLAKCQDSRQNIERYVAGSDDTYHLVRIRAHQGADEDEQAGVVLAITDLSALRKAQQEIELLSKAVGSSRDAVIILSPERRVIVWNAAAAELYGYSDEEILGSSFDILMPVEQRAEFDAALRDAISGRPRIAREATRETKDGVHLDVSSTLSVIFDRDGAVMALSVIERDVSERKERERALAERERMLTDLFHNSPDMLVSTDTRSGMLLEVNQTFLDQLGYSLEEAQRMHFTNLYTEASQVLAREYMQQFRLTGELRDVELEMRRKDGSTLEVALSATALRNEHGEVERSRTVIRNIAERKRAERQLAAASQMRERFLALVSHELRTPMHAIRSAADVLHHETTDREVQQRALDIVQRQSAQMTRLLDDLLDVARITTDKLDLDHVPLDLRQAVSDAVDAVRSRYQARQIALNWAPPDEPWPMVGDPARLQQVFANLLNNSLRHCTVGGRVDITGHREGHICNVSVRDDGEGIEAEQLESIFELFAQAPQSIAREMRGLGLGLSISQKIITAHDGTLVAASPGKGQGAMFTASLPLDPAAHRRESHRPNGSALRIVLVEDQDDSRAMMQFVLERRGHEVTTAADGPSAIEAIVAVRPDVALVDIGLPGADGFEVARRVRAALGNKVKLVALTGYGQPTDIARSRESGFDRHVTKPLAPDKLELILRELMNASS